MASSSKPNEPNGDASAPAAPRPPAASVRGVSKKFGGVTVLEDIHCEVAQGEALVLLGSSGSGKTTILRIIAGLEEPDSGSVVLHGRDVTRLPARERGVGVIFQDYALFPNMTVEQNIGYGLRIRRRPRREIATAVERLLELVKLADHRHKVPSQLSGGQRQRVAIARTLAYQPQVLLFDEPFGALDAQTRLHLRREIRVLLKEVDMSAIFITHDQEEALEIGDRIAVLNAGRIEQIGTPEQVYTSPATEYVARFLGAANLLLGVVRGATVEVGDTRIEARLETRRLRHGHAVKLVFRPEDVVLAKSPPLPEGCRALATGTIDEARLVGAFERVTVRINLFPRRAPQVDPLFAAVTAEAEAGLPLIATRSRAEASALPLAKGDVVQVGLMALRVLPNYTLATERSSRVVDFEG
jgi:ABC-type Fe3+/spermidine/putrescine transport system ATPase subunit